MYGYVVESQKILFDNIICMDNLTDIIFDSSCDSGLFYFKAIENSGGIPFQLIFGKSIGEGYYLKIGEGILKLLGIPAERFTEKLFQSMIMEIHPLSDNIPFDSQEARRRFLNGEIKNYKADLLLITPTSDRKWIRDSSVPIFDKESGKVVGAFGILTELSNILQSHVNDDPVPDRAEEYERLKAAFLQNISHEIRTPLNAIVGFTTLLSEQIPSDDSRREYIDIISNSADHLAEVIDDIVEISKIEAGTVKISKEKVEINKLLLKIYDQFSRPAAEKSILLVFSKMPDKSVSDILTDSNKVSQVLRYLVNNAIKFTDKGKVEFGYSLRDGFIEFYVSDTGIGIPEEFQKNLFRHFYQAENSTNRRFQGTGLGLAISKAYIELLGGRIWYESKPSGGSVFRFIIPEERAGEDIISLLKSEITKNKG